MLYIDDNGAIRKGNIEVSRFKVDIFDAFVGEGRMKKSSGMHPIRIICY